jgi:hypothetical protein
MTAQPRLRTCEAPGCTEQIRAGDFLCADHWAHVPEALHERLMRAWQAYEQAGVGDALKLAGENYRAARRACIEAIGRKLQSRPFQTGARA